MITLPSRPRRACLRSFSLAVSLCSGVLIGATLTLLLSFQWVSLGAVPALVLAFPTLFCPHTLSRLYDVWNRMALLFNRVARLWLTGICFYIVLATVGLTGSRLRLAHPTASESLWVPRKTVPPATYKSQWVSIEKNGWRKGWIRSFVFWAFHSGNLWAAFVLPFLILLCLLEGDEESSAPTRIYTLF